MSSVRMVARPPNSLVAATWDRLARDLLRDGARGTVHSGFEQAVNLRVPGGPLVGVVGPAAGNGPATIVLKTVGRSGFLASGIDAGQPWAAQTRRLVLADRRVIVDLSEARVWPAAPTRRTVPFDEAERRIRRARELAARQAPRGGLAPLLGGFESLFGEIRRVPEAPERPHHRAGTPALDRRHQADPLIARASAASRALVTAWRARDPTAVHRAAVALSGLGPGLTPSGDDLLAGFLIGIERFGAPASHDCVGLDAGLVEAVTAATTGRTTDVAVARVARAANGLIEERIEAVVAAILTGDGRDLGESVARAATWGHTSGIDTLVGLFLGLELRGIVSGTARGSPG